MPLRRRIALALATAMLGSVFSAAAAIAPAEAASRPAWTKNCTKLNQKYPHGIGKAKATDSVSSGKSRVTNFKRSNSLYKLAMSYNRGLDRDHDGVACEKA